MEMNGHECVAFCEIDKYARQSYKAIYDTEGEKEWHDITQVSNDNFRSFRGRADVITGGFPCQAFSVAGNRRGFEDTRGTLFFEIARAIKEIEPSYILLENVKGLFSHDKGRTFGTIIQTLDELGYIVEWGLFNSKFWGVPQNRERVFILVTRKDIFKEPKLFDLLKQQTENSTKLMDILEDEVEEKYYLSDKKTKGMTLTNDLSGELNCYNFKEVDKIHSVEKVAPTMGTMQGGNRQPKIAVADFKEVVRVRKYKVEKNELSELLKQTKKKINITNKYISEKLDLPLTKVEHYFRTDSSFAIPDESIWDELKELLGIETDKFDKSIKEFELKESNFDTTNRIYDTEYISPTINTTAEPKIAVKEATKKGYSEAYEGNSVNYQFPTSETRRGRVGKQLANTLEASGVNQGTVTSDLRIRKLTPLECWRLQGFTDEQFYKAKNDGVSNSQLYKQAGNSVTVNVIDAISKKF